MPHEGRIDLSPENDRPGLGFFERCRAFQNDRAATLRPVKCRGLLWLTWHVFVFWWPECVRCRKHNRSGISGAFDCLVRVMPRAARCGGGKGLPRAARCGGGKGLRRQHHCPALVSGCCFRSEVDGTVLFGLGLAFLEKADEERAQPHRVTRGNEPGLDPLVIDPAAIAAAEVDEPDLFSVPLESGVPTRQFLVRKKKIALRIAADDQRMFTDLVLGDTVSVPDNEFLH